MQKWTDNDIYIINNLVEEDKALQNAWESYAETRMEDSAVSATQGKFLYMIAKICNAKRILELGTFCGYSTIWLARAVPDDGAVISIENDETHVSIARRNIDNAGLINKVNILYGDAVVLLNKLITDKEEPFDLIFFDAHKPDYHKYLELSLELSRAGTVIYGDNVVRNGELYNSISTDPKVNGVRVFIEELGRLKNVESTALQTVGIKGYDGFTMSIVR